MNTGVKRELDAVETKPKPAVILKRRKTTPPIPIDLNAALAIAARVVSREAQTRSNTEKVSYPAACRAGEPLHKIRRHSFIGHEKLRLLSEGKTLVDYDFGDTGVTLKWERCAVELRRKLEPDVVQVQASGSLRSSLLASQNLPAKSSARDRKPYLSGIPRADDDALPRAAIPGLSTYNRLGVPAGTLEDPIDITVDFEQSYSESLPNMAVTGSDANPSSSRSVLDCVPSSRATTSRKHKLDSRLLDIFDSDCSLSGESDARADEQTSFAISNDAGATNTPHIRPNPKATSVPPIAVHDLVHDTTEYEAINSSDKESVDENLSVGVDESLILEDNDDDEGHDPGQVTGESSFVGNSNVAPRRIPSDDDSSELDTSDSASSTEEENEPPQFGRFRRPDASTKLARYNKGIQLPRVPNGRPRRLLLSPMPNEPMMSVSMRGDVQFVSTITKSRIANKSLPAEDESYRVEDACQVGTHAVLAHGSIGEGKHEIAVISTGTNKSGRPTRTFLSKRAHGADGAQGISCIAPFVPFDGLSDTHGSQAPLEFITGGNDKNVVLWRVRQSQTTGVSPKPTLRTTTALLTGSTKLNSRAIALARHPQADAVHATAGRRLWSVNIETGKASNVRFSNDILHLHVPLMGDPSLLLAEVDHMYAQMQLLDLRSPTRARPILEFGRAIPDKSPTVDSSNHPGAGLSNSRKRRGDTTSRQFVRGYHDGKVFLWDYRALRHQETSNGMIIGDCKVPVWHTAFGKRKGEVWSFSQEGRGGRGGIVHYFEI